MNKAWWLLVLNLFTFSLEAKGSRIECSISLKTGKSFQYQTPLIFKSSGELLVFEEDVKSISHNQELIFSCTPNLLIGFERQSFLKVKCDGNNNKFVTKDGKSFNANDFKCDLRAIEEDILPVERCSDSKWNSTKFGFYHPLEEKTFVIGEACYDELKGTSVFNHIKLGKDNYFLYKMEQKFPNLNFYPSSQFKMDLFKSLDFSEIYARIKEGTKLRRFLPLDLTSFIDENLLINLQLQSVKKLGWNYYVKPDEQTSIKKIQQAIKELSSKQDVDLYIGSFGVSTLYGPNNQMTLYMDDTNKRFPMPKFVWILINTSSKSLTFVVYTNKDEAETDRKTGVTASLNKCQDVNDLFNDLNIGNDVICSSYNDLKKVFPKLPNLI